MVAAAKGDTSMVALQRRVVWLTDNKVMLHIHVSEADQGGKGTDITLAPCSIAKLYPVRAVKRLRHPGRGT